MTESARSASTSIGDSKKIEWKRKMQADLKEFEEIYFKQQRNESVFDYKILALSVIAMVIFIVLLYAIGSTLWNTKWSVIRFFNKLLILSHKKKNLSKAETVFKFFTKMLGKSGR